METFNCPKPVDEIAQMGKKKPIVISNQRLTKMLNDANQVEKVRFQKKLEEEQKYREYLKKGSDELVAKFKGNMQRTQDEKLAQIKANMDRKMVKIKAAYDLAKENEEVLRQQKLVKAQELIEQLKPGPRKLHSAAIQSEVLRARNVQQNLSFEYNRAMKQQECLDQSTCQANSLAFIQEEQERQMERRQIFDNYKKEVLNTANEKNRLRTECKKQFIKEEREARLALDQEIKDQIEREKHIMEKKRAILRKNALEAMKMVEQRRLRDRMTEEIEQRLCNVYNVGVHMQEVAKKEELAKKEEEKKKPKVAVGQGKEELQDAFVRCVQKTADAKEDAAVRRDISRMQLKFTAEEQEKIQKEKAAKQARIEAYLHDQERQKQAKQRSEEVKRYEMAQRFKNAELNRFFDESQKKLQIQKSQETRALLKGQVAEKNRKEREEKKRMRECVSENIDREDKFFFQYARDLMEDAYKKARPLYPLNKVVQQYKRENRIDCETKIPKHLQSHIDIGVRPPANEKISTEKRNLSKSPPLAKPSNKDKTVTNNEAKANILQNCLKITELVAAEASGKKGDCFEISTKKPDKYLQTDVDCKLISGANKTRYTMFELKLMNKFTGSQAPKKPLMSDKNIE